MNLFIAILRFPWWVHLAIAGLIVYFGFSMQEDVEQAKMDLQAALEADAPEATPLHLFQPASNVGLLKEGRILAQINTDYNYRLINKTNGVTTSETAMYVLFGPDADGTATNVQAVVMVAPGEVDAFADWVTERIDNFGNIGLVYDIHGRFSSSHGKSTLARDALRDEGLTPASNLQFITPYLEGREAGLEKAASQSEGSQWIIYLIAASFAMLGFAKFAFGRSIGRKRGGGGRGAKRPQPDPLAPVDTSQRPVPLMAEPGTPETAWANMQTGQRENPLNALIADGNAAPAAATTTQGVGPKATRAAKLMEKQRMLAQAAPAEQPRATNVKARMSALEQARAFKRTAKSASHEAKYFRDKMKQDPFAKLGQ
ncbi:MAG: hypothetical protein AAGI10_12605 [Pseudomonadota bacterium]